MTIGASVPLVTVTEPLAVLINPSATQTDHRHGHPFRRQRPAGQRSPTSGPATARLSILRPQRASGHDGPTAVTTDTYNLASPGHGVAGDLIVLTVTPSVTLANGTVQTGPRSSVFGLDQCLEQPHFATVRVSLTPASPTVNSSITASAVHLRH